MDARTVRLAERKLDVAVAGEDACLEVGFPAGVVPSGDIHVRADATDWSPLDQSDDHSFDLAAEDLVDAARITLHRGDRLVWGVEPVGPPRRMLADPKAAALTASFGVPWLQFGKLASARRPISSPRSRPAGGR